MRMRSMACRSCARAITRSALASCCTKWRSIAWRASAISSSLTSCRARAKNALPRALPAQFPLGRASVHPSLRVQPFFLARERLARHADEAMAQLDAQRRRHGPQFRHGERLHIVKGQQRTFQPRLGERRAAAFQERASEQGDARQSLHGGAAVRPAPRAPVGNRLPCASRCR